MRWIAIFAVVVAGLVVVAQQRENTPKKVARLKALHASAYKLLSQLTKRSYEQRSAQIAHRNVVVRNLADILLDVGNWGFRATGQHLVSPEESGFAGAGPPYEEEVIEDEELDSSYVEDAVRKALDVEEPNRVETLGEYLLVAGDNRFCAQVEKVCEKLRVRRGSLDMVWAVVRIAEVEANKVGGRCVVDEKGLKHLLAGGRILQVAFLSSVNGVSTCVFDGKQHAITADIDTSGMGGMTPVATAEPVVRAIREGLTLNLTLRKREKGVYVKLSGSLAELLKMGERAAMGPTMKGEEGIYGGSYKVDVPQMRYDRITMQATVATGQSAIAVCRVQNGKALIVVITPGCD